MSLHTLIGKGLHTVTAKDLLTVIRGKSQVYDVKVIDKTPGDISKALNCIDKEVSRLLARPELIPEDYGAEKFFGRLYEICTKTDIVEEQWKKLHLYSFKIHEQIMKKFQQENQPAYDAKRAPWDQFLHDKAPGSGAKNFPEILRTSTQFLPFPGIGILRRWLLDYQHVVDAIVVVSKIFTLYTFN